MSEGRSEEPPPSVAPPSGPASAPPPASSAPESRLEAVADAVEGATASLAHGPPSLAALLTVASPGLGHVYLRVEGAKKTTAFILLGATVATVVLCGFVSWPLGLLVYLVAAAYGLTSLKEELAPVQQARASRGALGTFADLGSGLSWRLVIAGGLLLSASLFMPWYRESVEGFTGSVTGFDAFRLIDVALLAIGAGSAVAGVVGLQQGTAGRPAAGRLAAAVAAAGALALLLVVFRLLLVADGGLDFDIERAFGALMAYAAAVLLAGGAMGAAAAQGSRGG